LLHKCQLDDLPFEQRPGSELIIKKYGVSTFSWAFLKRQRDKIPEATARHRVLIRKETIIRIKTDLGPASHRFCQNERPKLSSKTRGDRLGEENPNMTAVA